MATAAKRYRLGPVTQIPEGEGRTFDVGGQRVAVFRARGGAIYASQASCPHRQGPLSEGLLGKSTLICPLHEWRFDLTTGKALAGECGIAVYPIAASADGNMTLELPDQ